MRAGPVVCTAPVPAALAGWALAGAPAGLAGMGVFLAAAQLVIVTAALALAAPGQIGPALVPREKRAAYRWHHRQAHKARYGTDMPRPRAGRVEAGSRLERMVIAGYRGRCAGCYARARVTLAYPQIDHITSWAGGGLTWFPNLGCLCARCNQVKSNWNKSRDGYVHYRPFYGRHDPDEAARITRACQLARRNPLVWWRAAWAM